MKVLLIGSNGLVARDFVENTNHICQIDKIDKENSDTYINLLKDQQYDFLIFTAQSGDYKNQHFSKDLFYVNIQYLFNVVSACEGRVGNIIFFSSGSVYDPSPAELDENSPLNLESKSPYVISKISAELILKPFLQKFNSVTILRPFFIYGPKQNEQMLIKSIIAKVENSGEIFLKNGKGLIFNPVYVRDVSMFLEQLIQRSTAGLFTYNLFGPERTTLAKIVTIIASRLNIEPNTIEVDEPPMTMVAKSNYTIFQPKIGVDEGIGKTLDD
jgi:nucleoside-diphosphate-sugar epimerase